jgi:hypothetical protein
MRPQEHRDALLALWRANLSDPRIADVAPERFRWLYDQNPAGPAHTWLGVDGPTGEVIGCGSLVPRRMLVDGAPVAAAILGDFAVSPQHRTAGAAIAIQRAVAQGGPPAGFAFQLCYPNETALPIFRRVRYQPVGEARTWVKPLRSEYKIREYLPAPWLARAAGAVVDVGLRANDWRTFAARRPRPYRTCIADSADHRFDRLWANARPRYITGERTAAYLNWRYAGFTSASYRFFCLLGRSLRWNRRLEDEALVGYVVYQVKDNKVFVADLFCDFERDTERLLFAFADRMRGEGHYSISVVYLGNDFLARALDAQHFIRRPTTRSLLIAFDKAAPERLKGLLLDAQSWLMVDGELDI